MRVQPWYRGCHERSKRILATRTAAVVVVQSWARRMSARALRDRRQWASDEIGLWLVEETWIGPIVDQHRLRTDVVAPELVDEFLFTGSDFFETSVCAGVARRRDAGATIHQVLRHRPRHYPPSRLAGKPPSGWRGPRVLMHPAALRQNDRSEEEGRGKGSLDGVARAKVRVFVRHRSATLLNRTANAWVHYVKMERAWRPLLAFQVCRVFLRRCARTQSICERRLRRNVAAVRLQAAARGYVLRRARGEAHAGYRGGGVVARAAAVAAVPPAECIGDSHRDGAAAQLGASHVLVDLGEAQPEVCTERGEARVCGPGRDHGLASVAPGP